MVRPCIVALPSIRTRRPGTILFCNQTPPNHRNCAVPDSSDRTASKRGRPARTARARSISPWRTRTALGSAAAVALASSIVAKSTCRSQRKGRCRIRSSTVRRPRAARRSARTEPIPGRLDKAALGAGAGSEPVMLPRVASSSWTMRRPDPLKSKTPVRMSRLT